MRIGIIGAMEEEVTILRKNMSERVVERVASCEYTSGTMHGVEVILLRSGIGKVSAAMSTAILLDRYQPDLIINTGSAGGLNHALNVGDIVISTEVRHHDVDATAFGYAYGQVPQMPAAFSADEKLIAIAEKCAKKMTNIQVVKGLIATGDSFMSDPDRVEKIRQIFAHLQAVEMEGAAIAQVAHQFETPFVIIRSLSDIAGKKSEISFEQFLQKAAYYSSHLVMDIVKTLKED